MAQNNPDKIFIGTYTGGESKGIYTADFSSADGGLNNLQLAAETPSPSFLAIHPNKKFLYAVNELDSFQGQKAGAVTSFEISPDGKLRKLNDQSTEGAHPCHLLLDKAGKHVLVANYTGGSIAVFPVSADGTLGKRSAFVQHTGSSVDKRRQEAPHAHSIHLDPANKFVISADLGVDKLLVYRFDSAKGTLTPNNPPSVSLKPGGGPRHFAWHPSGKLAISNLEMTSELTSLSYDPEKGSFQVLHTISTLPKETPGNSTAEALIHPNGKYVYVSNRGHNSIAVIELGPKGELKLIENESTQGRTPRNFNIDPTGKWLLAANQDSDSIVNFKINPDSGKLEPAGHSLKAPKPVCVKFYPVGQ